MSLNFAKTGLIQFLAKNSSHIPISAGCDNNIKFNITNIKFLGMIGNTLMEKSQIEIIIWKLSVACFVVRVIKPFVTQDTLKMVYYSGFHSIMNYGIIFWGNSLYSNSIFKQQKRIIIIIMVVGMRDS